MERFRRVLRHIAAFGKQHALRTISLVLVVVLAYQTTLGSGVAYAVADGLQSMREANETAILLDSAGSEPEIKNGGGGSQKLIR